MYLSREKLNKAALISLIFVLCVAIVSVILTGVKQFKVGSQLSSVSQVSNLSHLLVRQQANLFSLMLVKNTKTEELTAALDAFAHEDFVIDANLYSASGQLLAQSQNALDLKQNLTSPQHQLSTQQIVEPIFVKEDLAGFLRVTFDAQYVKTAHNKIDELFHQLYGQLIILVLAGALFASSVHYIFPKRKVVMYAPVRQTVEKNKGQSHRFHSQRRRYQRK